MQDENKLVTERKGKIAEWEKLGFSGYAEKFDRTHTSQQARAHCEKAKLRDADKIMAKPKNDVKMCGRIMNFREMGKLAFLRILDTNGDFQICLTKNVLGDLFKDLQKILDLGDFVGFSGEFFITKHGEPTLLVSEVTPLAKTLRPLPEKWAGLSDRESCYRQRYLDMLTNKDTAQRFRIRSQVVREIRNFFEEKDFIEVETRMLQSQAGGAMAKVFETHHNALDHPFVLRIALELDHKMLLAGGMERVYEIGKCFRNEGMDPSHLQEFTMLEWYAAYANLDQNMSWTEEMIREVLMKVLGKTKVDILNAEEKLTPVDFGKKWKRVKFADLLKEYAKVDMEKITKEEAEKVATTKWGLDKKEAKTMSRGSLLDHIYKKSARPHLIQPTFVMDYPSELKPLARPKGDGSADCYQLLVAGWEIVNSYGELIDPQVQRKLLEDQAKAKAAGDPEAMDMNEEFITAMEHGFPPMTGFGMGIDRFVALITQQPNLRDVVLFPLMRPDHTGTDPQKAKETMLAVAVINSEAGLERWQELNAIGHLTAAFGAREGKKMFEFDSVQTQDNEKIALNIQHAIMIKSGKGKSLKQLREKALKAELHVAEFTREMIETTDDKKVRSMTAGKKLSDVEHLGILVYGPKKVVESLTKGYDLFS